MKYLKPQRMLKISSEEEQARCKCTWQMFDRALWVAAFADEELLADIVADPKEFIKNREDIVIGASDQVPYWCTLGPRKQLYLQSEVSKSKKERTSKENLAGHSSQISQTLSTELEGLEDEEETQKMTQTRGEEASENSKLRITLEMRQLVYNYFKPGADPVGALGVMLVIFPGTHARLDNIGEDGCFIKDEQFDYAGKRVVRRAGQNARGLMKSFVALRKDCPDLFKNLVVMQQPAAFIDGILHHWSLEDLFQRYPRSIWQRDALQTHMSEQAVADYRLGWQVPVWIAGKMTPVLQLTDTDIAFLMKAYSQTAKEKVACDMKALAREAGVRASFEFGTYDILKVIQEANTMLEKKVKESNLVLAAFRRNGMLAYRPCFKEGRLVLAGSQAWCKDLPQGSHRMKPVWLADRAYTESAGGMPAEADWSICKTAKKLADHMEAEYCEAQEVEWTVAGQKHWHDSPTCNR